MEGDVLGRLLKVMAEERKKLAAMEDGQAEGIRLKELRPSGEIIKFWPSHSYGNFVGSKPKARMVPDQPLAVDALRSSEAQKTRP